MYQKFPRSTICKLLEPKKNKAEQFCHKVGSVRFAWALDCALTVLAGLRSSYHTSSHGYLQVSSPFSPNLSRAFVEFSLSFRVIGSPTSIQLAFSHAPVLVGCQLLINSFVSHPSAIIIKLALAEPRQTGTEIVLQHYDQDRR